jgi:hypothetical protein
MLDDNIHGDCGIFHYAIILINPDWVWRFYLANEEGKMNRPEWQGAKYGMYLECPYDADFIEELKSTVPPDERKWDSVRKQWWISDAWLDEVDALLREHFEVSGYGRD